MWNGYFPEDIMLLVLLRLPARSLVRFKTVSKSWNAQISSSEFIKLHVNQSQTKPDMLLYDFISRKPTSLKILLLEFSSKGENIVSNIRRLNNPFKSLGLSGQPYIVGGPCNGLLCLKRGWDIYILYNPLTKSSWHLPLTTGGNNTYDLYFYGFGYDDIHDDYKLVMFYRKSWIEHECEIYSLRSNSWTTIGLHLEGKGQQHNNGTIGVFFNCSLHWIFGSSIIAFDLRAEEFTFLPVPYKVVEEHDILELNVLNGCLFIKTYNNISYDMWLMKDYCVTGSWIKLTTCMPSDIWRYLRPVALLEGKRKMVFYDNGKMLLYDLVKDEVLETTIIRGCEDFVMPRQHEFFVSLVDPLRFRKPRKKINSVIRFNSCLG